MGAGFWLRWSWRGLRRRLTQVAAIAAIIALGSGVYAGLGSTSAWRRLSLDATFAQLHAHDLEVASPSGLALPAGRLLQSVQTAAGRAVTAAEARLIVDLPVRAGRGGSIPAAGVIVGVDLARGVAIDRWKVMAGRSIGAADAHGTDILLDEHFAAQHHLPPTGRITIAGKAVTYVGTVLEPEYLNQIATLGATIQGAATRAVVFAPIALVQRLAGAPGGANDVVAMVRPGDRAGHVAQLLKSSLPRLEPAIALTVTVRRDDRLVRALYGEISSEQRIFDVFALLILAGAGFAAFNLTRRVVESERRDIGVAMALGVPRRQIAIRPMLLAAEIAAAGVVLGLPAGWGIGSWVLTIIKARIPLPVWETPWQVGLFLVGAVLGLVVPLAGSAYPVWRAVRVEPTDALLPPHLRGGRHRLSSLVRRLRLPGSTTAQAPLRRILIAPARSLMTVLAIALILAPLLTALGATDSTSATIAVGNDILAGARGDRLLVTLTGYEPDRSAAVRAITGSRLVREAAVGLDTGGSLTRGSTTVDVSISMVDLSNPLVVPADLAKQHVEPGGIVLSAKAAADLGVRPGSLVQLRHPKREGTGFRFVRTVVPVRAVVASPYRFVAYMDLRDEAMMGVQHLVNSAVLVPRRGVSIGALQRAISSLPRVASALPASSLSNTMQDILSVVSNLFVLLQAVIGALAFLVAYNSAKIGGDERAREHATMLAFGLPVRRLVGIGVVESVILGALGIGLSLGLGLLVLRWVLDSVFPAAVPELAVIESVRAVSYVLTAVVGLAAVALAPLLITRRLRTMSLPSTLRYVE